MPGLVAAHITGMKKTQHKNQVGQASKNGGEFAAKTHEEATTMVLPDTEFSTVAAQIRSSCEDAGLPGVMNSVFQLIFDGTDTTDTLMNGYLDELSASDVTDAYNNHIGPAVDAVEDYIGGLDTHVTNASDDDAMAHGRSICEEVGFPGVMVGIIRTVVDRGETLEQTAGLTGSDIEVMYGTIVEPAISDLEDDIRENHCSECGASLDDGEGYDGLCGNCADRAEAAGRWS